MMERHCLKKNIWESKLPCCDKTCSKDHCVTSNWQSLTTVSKETRTSAHSHEKLILKTNHISLQRNPTLQKGISFGQHLVYCLVSPQAEDTAKMCPWLSKAVRWCIKRLTSLKAEASSSPLMEIWMLRALLWRWAMHRESGSPLSGDTGKDLNSKSGMNWFL